MKTKIIAALVGGVILWLWQFMSWSMLNIHGSSNQYTPSQDAILQNLKDVNLKQGTYFLPTAPPGTSMEDREALYEKSVGKPWASLHYQESLEMTMGMNMFRGFVVNVLAVFFLCYILVGDPNLSFQKVITSSILVGLIGYLTISYLGTIWFKMDSIPYLIDSVVQWGLCGAWLGWFLTRK